MDGFCFIADSAGNTMLDEFLRRILFWKMLVESGIGCLDGVVFGEVGGYVNVRRMWIEHFRRGRKRWMEIA